MSKIILCLVICLSFCMQSCDGFRELRVEINLKNEQPEYEYSKTVSLIDDFAKKNGFTCSSCVDNYNRHYSFNAINLVSKRDEKNDIFSIELYEFGPPIPTKEYQLFCRELSELVKNNFKEQSVTLNSKCSGS